MHCHHMHGSHLHHQHHPLYQQHQQHHHQQQPQQHQIYQQIPTTTVNSGPTTTATHSIYNSATINSSTANATATMRRYPNQPNTAAGQVNRQPDIIDTIPNSNSVDSAMFERDKQIYRCSTLRQGGKFDGSYKPSILNCPLPEIPKEVNESSKQETVKEQNTTYSKTLQRPPMKLPPTAKPIPPPKIDTPTSPPRNGTLESNSPLTKQKMAMASPEQKAQITSPQTVQSPKTPNSNSTTITSSNETTINPNDESNYAVTEL